MPPTKRQTTAKKSAPRPQRQASPPSSSARFGQGWQRGQSNGFEELVLPSGAVALVKQVETTDIIRLGLMDKMDLLTGSVDENIVQPAKKGAAAKKTESSTVFKGAEALAMLEIADKIITVACVEPSVRLAPTPRCKFCGWEGMDTSQHTDDHEFDPVPRDPNAIYTDGVPMADKFEILQFAVQGVAALNTFRK